MTEYITNKERNLPEYPNAERGLLSDRAFIEFSKRIDEHGRGKNWMEDESRVHIFKAVDELFLARGCESEGDVDGMIEHEANALNHMLFSLEIARSNDR